MRRRKVKHDPLVEPLAAGIPKRRESSAARLGQNTQQRFGDPRHPSA
jgi:hypothetical protein